MRDYDFYYTQDGSIGLYSYADNDVYHSKFGALTEAWEKFVIPSGIDKKLNQVDNIKILDVCYGIGYNTKAIMSYIINSNEKNINKKNKNFLKKFFEKIKKRNPKSKTSNETIDINNNSNVQDLLSNSNDTIGDNNSEGFNLQNTTETISKIQIDCLDINNELVKISPLLKTVITPQEIFSRIVPRIFNCFESYWKIKKYIAKISFKIAPRNRKEITELLDLKFNNDYDIIDNEYRIHKFVNYILVNALVKHFGNKYIDKTTMKYIRNRKIKRFFEQSLINYAIYKQSLGYKLLSKFNLLAFLHNIYYDHLSNRYKKASFKTLESLFNINYYIEDARKSILKLSDQYDLIFLDAFTFSKAPELWTVEFMAELYRRLSPTGVLITYSNSALVRNTFIENKFYVGKIIDKTTGKCIGTIATKEKNLIYKPLSNFELGLCATKAGITYHDPTLSDSKEVILKRREKEFKTSELPTSSQYMRKRTTINGESDNEE